VDHRDSGPPWTSLRHRLEELTGALQTGAPIHESSPRLLRKNEELIGVRSRASPEAEEQRGGWAMAVKIQRRRCSVRALLRRGERGKEAGRGAVKLEEGGCSPFIGGWGCSGWKCRWVTAGDLQRTPLMGGGVLMGIQEGESRRGSKVL
jgi:hypothetical protein